LLPSILHPLRRGDYIEADFQMRRVAQVIDTAAEAMQGWWTG
jgi:hypothetical protein